MRVVRLKLVVLWLLLSGITVFGPSCLTVINRYRLQDEATKLSDKKLRLWIGRVKYDRRFDGYISEHGLWDDQYQDTKKDALFQFSVREIQPDTLPDKFSSFRCRNARYRLADDTVWQDMILFRDTMYCPRPTYAYSDSRTYWSTCQHNISYRPFNIPGRIPDTIEVRVNVTVYELKSGREIQEEELGCLAVRYRKNIWWLYEFAKGR